MDIIASKDNARVKAARRLLKKKGRKETGNFLIEGFHLLQEALKSDEEVICVFATPAVKGKIILGDYEILWVSEAVLASISDEETPQGVVAIIKQRKFETVKYEGKLLVLENIKDPGNVGTMIRTADAAGFDGIVVLSGTSDIYSPKVLRSAQGSHFHLPLFFTEPSEFYAGAKNVGQPLLVTTLSEDSIDYRVVKLPSYSLVMGNEAKGISEEAKRAADYLVHIPMDGAAESLNVAIAAGILVFGIKN